MDVCPRVFGQVWCWKVVFFSQDAFDALVEDAEQSREVVDMVGGDADAGFGGEAVDLVVAKTWRIAVFLSSARTCSVPVILCIY